LEDDLTAIAQFVCRISRGWY